MAEAWLAFGRITAWEREIATCERDNGKVLDDEILLRLLVSFAYSVTSCALLKDFTLKKTIIRAVLDAQMSLTLSHTAMSVTGCTTYSLLSGDMLQYCHGEIIFYMS